MEETESNGKTKTVPEMMKEERDGAFEERFAAWTRYQGRMVCLQLRDSYAGVTGAAAGLVFNDDKTLVAVPFLRGILSVERDGAGVRILISTPDPNPHVNGMARILVDPAEVAFCTAVDVEAERRIVAP